MWNMSEDRDKHDRAGTEVPVGRRLGRPLTSRIATAKMGQRIPDRVRRELGMPEED